MASFGCFALLISFVGAVLSVICLIAGHALRKKDIGETISWSGRIATIVTFVGLTACCAILIICFITDDFTIQYVLTEHSSNSNLLFKISGLWAGREGSLLFWAWLISLFNTIVAVRRLGETEPLDNMAVLVGQIVLLAFVGVMLFSDSNIPFTATETKYLSNGELTTSGKLLGMNTLLEHWAMAIHPPTLFAGYAGLTIPFAYGIAACIVNDSSKLWVQRSERYALVAWFFLTVGIGLGSIWAYTVLGWGGFWGWDPVENASLLPWLVSVALIHSFRQYKARRACKRWAVMCAALAFCFCIVGTFISRSGLVQSVHAFEGDPVSLVLFGALIALSVIAGLVCIIVRRDSFADEGEELQSFASKEGAFWLNNLLMVVFALLLTYLTIAQALPEFLPFGGQSIGTGSYESIARPLGILYLLLLAVCPMLAWKKTNPKEFFQRAKWPAVGAVVVFVVLMVYACTTLFPRYQAIIDAGGTAADELLSYGPQVYYYILTVVGLLVAALLFFNSVFQLIRAAKLQSAGVRAKLPGIGSAISHMGMGIILVGLIGSMMYVTENAGYIAYDSETDTASETFTVLDYELTYMGMDIETAENGSDTDYTVTFSVTKDGQYVGEVSPKITWVNTTQQQKMGASVLGFGTEDLFVVFKGISSTSGGLSMDVRVNPLISCVWAGFYCLCAGMLIAALGRRNSSKKPAKAAALADSQA